METKLYVLNREWIKSTHETAIEEVAQFNTLDLARTMLKAMCEKEHYRLEVEWTLIDTIGAVRAVWCGGGEPHCYWLSEEHLNENGERDEWA